jgi:NTE family protein
MSLVTGVTRGMDAAIVSAPGQGSGFEETTSCLVLSGGVALGAYQGGAYAALHGRQELWPARIAGSSVGAVNGALIAGTPPDERVRTLGAFWRGSSSDGWWPAARWLGGLPGPYGDAYRWLQVLQTRLLGCPGVMRPRIPLLAVGGTVSLYDLSPLRARLETMLDFDRLNRGEIRFSVTTTDIETGEAVTFDTGRGDRIGPDHLIASCGFLPEFPALQIGERLLGDGGLAANAPLEAILHDESTRDANLLCFVVDLFAPPGRRPATLGQAAARSLDLLFANQTARALQDLEHEQELCRAAGVARRSATIVTIRHRGRPHDLGPQKIFDFSSAALAERWDAGYADMAEVLSAGPRARTGYHGQNWLDR